MDVGNKIKVEDGCNFTFSKGTAFVFDSHIQNSVPLYNEGHQYIAYLSDYFLRSNSICYDLGCSTGTLLKILAERHKNKENMHFFGIDPEVEMIDQAMKENKYSNIEFSVNTAEKIKLKKCDLLICYYTLQFISLDKRQEICNNVYSALNYGGAFILFEKELVNEPYISKMIESAYMKFKLKNDFTIGEIISKRFSLEGFLIPNTTNDNIDLLTSAGFKSIQCIMQYGEFKGYVAIKK